MIRKSAQPWNDTGPPLLRVIRTPNTRSITTTLEYPQSGERIRGRHNVQALRSQHPARPSGFVVRRMVGEGDLWVTEYVITYDGRRFNTVSIMEFQATQVVRETQYFAEPFEPPAWRAQWVERMT